MSGRVVFAKSRCPKCGREFSLMSKHFGSCTGPKGQTSQEYAARQRRIKKALREFYKEGQDEVPSSD